jgi:hypothetical protein
MSFTVKRFRIPSARVSVELADSLWRRYNDLTVFLEIFGMRGVQWLSRLAC